MQGTSGTHRGAGETTMQGTSGESFEACFAVAERVPENAYGSSQQTSTFSRNRPPTISDGAINQTMLSDAVPSSSVSQMIKSI